MSAILTGRRLSHYQLERQLGRGGMGAVYLGRDTVLDRPVAIKVLPPELTADEEYVARFVREARTAAKINHPRVVQVYGAGYQDGLAFMALELVQGGSLAGLAKQGPVPVRHALSLVKDAAEGLGAAHALGIIHRDVKPENILLGPQGQVKVADFGLARIETADRITKSGSYVGTPHYSSPEQCSGEPLGPASDLYSLGVVLYELLAGGLPFEAPTPLALFSKILSQPPPPLAERRPDLPPSLVALVERLLAKEPSGRPASAEALIAELESVLRGIPASEDDAGFAATLRLPPSGVQGTDTAAVKQPSSEASALLGQLRASGSAGPISSGGGELNGRVGRLAAVGLVLAIALGGLLHWASSLVDQVPTRPPRLLVRGWQQAQPHTAEFEWLEKGLPDFVLARLEGVVLVEQADGQPTELTIEGTFRDDHGQVVLTTDLRQGGVLVKVATGPFPQDEILARLAAHAEEVAAKLSGLVPRKRPEASSGAPEQLALRDAPPEMAKQLEEAALTSDEAAGSAPQEAETDGKAARLPAAPPPPAAKPPARNAVEQQGSGAAVDSWARGLAESKEEARKSDWELLRAAFESKDRGERSKARASLAGRARGRDKERLGRGE